MKYDIRSVDEKLNMILKLLEDEKRCSSYNETDDNFSQFDNVLPISTYEKIVEVENHLSTDRTYRAHFVSIYY